MGGDSDSAVLREVIAELVADANWQRHVRRLRERGMRTGNTTCIAAAEAIERRGEGSTRLAA